MSAMNAESILALGRNFMESRILLTGAELDLFTLLAPAPLSAAEVTRRVHGDERAVTILLDALAGIGLLSKRDGQYFASLAGAQGSGILTSMAQANGLMIVPEDKPVIEVGEEVQVQMLDWNEEM